MEAYIGFGGPLVGTVGALACYFAAREWNSALLLAISYSGFFLNLFNLIPVPPLDGGRITAVLSPRIWLLGLPILVAMFIYHPNPMLVIIAILAIPQVWRSFKTKEDSLTEQAYYDVPLETKIMYGTYYLALLIFLAMMVDGVHQLLPIR
jgi:Zn-dependent protease